MLGQTTYNTPHEKPDVKIVHLTAAKSNSEKYTCDEIRTKDATRRALTFSLPRPWLDFLYLARLRSC